MLGQSKNRIDQVNLLQDICMGSDDGYFSDLVPNY